ncbi:hypothetical protein DRJ17_02635 [Candidatus Woesearchaeota archaeon]|nr:MAG: hypothetical protein DRJ17_02635 [Candidatus Woesearchaeota archaeon]
MSEESKEQEKKAKRKKISKLMIWQVITIIFVALFAVAIATKGFTFGATGKVAGTITAKEAADKAINFINDNLLQNRVTANLTSYGELDGLYQINFTIAGQSYEGYTTLDGNLFFPQAIDLNMEIPKPEQQQELESQQIEKRDKPKAQVFVMSFCPYGLQFIKAYVPVIELLGDKADLEINFVDYAMHGKKEIDGNNHIYCVQREYRDKLAEYLRCFVKEGDYEGCIGEVGLDKNKIDSCINEIDEEFNITELYNDKSTWSGGRFPKYPIDSGLNDEFGVRGSPTFVLNGKQTNVNRSPEAIKQAICNAFNTPPQECETELSNSPAAPGVGSIDAQAGSGSGEGSCG